MRRTLIALSTLAFLVFAIMVFLFTASLFYMDRIRRRREERDRNEP